MKHILRLSLTVFAMSTIGYAQTRLDPANEKKGPGAQYFQKEGFKVQCNCKLETVPDFIESARKQGRSIIGAYACAENLSDATKTITIKVNVADESAGFSRVRADSINYYSGRYVSYMAADMKKRGFTTYEVLHNGQLGLECTGTQDKQPTMLLIVLRNKRVYTLSVSARKNVVKHFERVRSSFMFL